MGTRRAGGQRTLAGRSIVRSDALGNHAAPPRAAYILAMPHSVSPDAPVLLRPPRPGDFGWVVHRHGVLYAREYEFDSRFEALVARVIADFLRDYDATRERAWIAERDGEIIGSVFLASADSTTAKLRLLYVEPTARGLGVGTALVRACIAAAREMGYTRLVLWTNAVLTAARAIYVAEGFRLTGTEPHALFGPEQLGETWELRLTEAAPDRPPIASPA